MSLSASLAERRYTTIYAQKIINKFLQPLLQYSSHTLSTIQLAMPKLASIPNQPTKCKSYLFTTGCRLITTRSHDFSATRPPLAASQTARRVQAVYDGTSLLVRRRTILPGGPDHAVGRCNCQTWSQICRIQLSCSATNYIVARRPVLRGCWPTCMEQTSTTASSRLLS